MSLIKTGKTDTGATYNAEYIEGQLVNGWLNEGNILEEDFPYNETTQESGGKSNYITNVTDDVKRGYDGNKQWQEKEMVVVHDGKHYVTKGNNLVGKMENGYIDPYKFADGDVFVAVNPNNPNDVIYVQSNALTLDSHHDALNSDFSYNDIDKPGVANPFIQDTISIDQKGKQEWAEYKGNKSYKIQILEELPPVDKGGVNYFSTPANYDESISNPQVKQTNFK